MQVDPYLNANESHAAGAKPGSLRCPPFSLHGPDDEANLTPAMCLIRAQIEVFANDKTPSRRRRAPKTGDGAKLPKKSCAPGRVGIRCVHCSHLDPKERAKGAVSYPGSIEVMHQAVRNWKRYHYNECKELPESIRDEVSRRASAISDNHRKRCGSGVSHEDFWVGDCRRRGLRDANLTEGGGIIFVPSESSSDVTEDTAVPPLGLERSVSNQSLLNAEVPSRGSLDSGGSLGPKAPPGKAQNHSVAFSERSNDGACGRTFNGSNVDGPCGAIKASGIGGEGTSGNINAVSDANECVLACLPIHSSFLPDKVTVADTRDEYQEKALGSEKEEGSLHSPQLFHPPTRMVQMRPGAGIASDPTLVLEGADVSLSSGFGNDNGERRDRILQIVRIAHDAVLASRGIQPLFDAFGSGVATRSDPFTAEANDFDDRCSDNLPLLGMELYKLFAELDDEENGNQPLLLTSTQSVAYWGDAESDPLGSLGGQAKEEENALSKKRREGTANGNENASSTDAAVAKLAGMGLPTSIFSLISGLLRCQHFTGGGNGPEVGGGLPPCRSSDEVEQDLRLMCQDPDRYLFDVDPSEALLVSERLGTMDQQSSTGGRIYGQEASVAKLLMVYERARTEEHREAVFVSGFSGTGKSTMVRSMQGPFRQRGGIFLSGKFDSLQQVQPFSAIAAAFEEYCDLLLGGDQDVLHRKAEEIRKAVGDDGGILTNIIPRLALVIGNSSLEGCCLNIAASSCDTQKRLILSFGAFLGAIACPEHPLVLFLDDLQWADRASLVLVRCLVTNYGTSSFLFVGCYRDNEVGTAHPLTEQRAAMKMAGVVVTDIQVDNMDRDSINEMVSDALHLLPRQTQPLSQLVYNKTSGNALFVLQFLRSLFDEGLLHFSLLLRRWEWDLRAIGAKCIADNVVEFMTSKMQRLDPEVQWALKIAGCLGCQCDKAIVKFLEGLSANVPIVDLLDIAVDSGLMMKDGCSFQFSHDQVQHAAYALIPSTEQQAMHLRIGRGLLERASENDKVEGIIFTIVDQFQRGSNLIHDHSEKVQVAKLSLLAGKKAMDALAFEAALWCFLKGVELLESNDWEAHYALCLELYTCCAEAQLGVGNLDELEISFQAVCLHGRGVMDKFRASLLHILALAARTKLLEAVAVGMDLLAQLGESFSDHSFQEEGMKKYVAESLRITLPLVNGLLDKTEMMNPKKVASMQVLGRIYVYGVLTQKNVCPLFICRMVELSVFYGVSKETPTALALLGLLLHSTKGDIELGNRCASLSLSLVEKIKAKEQLPRVYFVTYGAIKIFVDPIQACVAQLRHSFEIGMQLGDIDTAMLAASLQIIQAFFSGLELEPLINEMRSYAHLMQKHKHTMTLDHILPYLQAALNLVSVGSEDPTMLSGEVMNYSDHLSQANEKEFHNVVVWTILMRMWLAYIFGRMDIARSQLIERRKHSVSPNATMVHESFYSGLIAAQLARTETEEMWHSIALESVEQMKKYAKHSSWNCQHRLELLNAEVALLDGQQDIAASAYKSSMDAAARHGFVHEEALACERAGFFYMDEGSISLTANMYFSRAHECYVRWGAKRKASMVLERIGR